MSTRTAALAAYRHILRSANIAFKGDDHLLIGAQQQARQGFERAKAEKYEASQAEQKIREAEDVALILRKNIVQGTKGESGPGPYKLRIHEEIERGDNESIKFGGQKMQEKPAE